MRVSTKTLRLAVLLAALVARPAVLAAESGICPLNEVQKLTSSDASADDRFGSSLSVSGDRAVVGAWFASSAYVFRYSDNGTPLDPADDSWVEEDKLTPSASGPGALFGWSVSISGDRAIVGARFDGAAGSQAGAAYVFRRDDNATPSIPGDDFWVEEEKLTAPDATAGDQFGGSVSASGDRVIVGAQTDDAVGEAAGSAYVFRRDDNGTPLDPSDDFWVEEDKITGSDEAPGDNFGFSVSISGDHAVVGAWHHNHAGERSGAAYVFRREDNGTPSDPSDDSWIEEDKLTAFDASPYDDFGVDVAIDGDRIVVGSWLDDDDGSLSGSAYVFRADDNGTPSAPDDDFWVLEAKLTAFDGVAGDEFGKSVSISGDRIAVGAFEDDDACADDPEPDPNCDSGSAYVFRRDDNGTPAEPGDDSWIPTSKLTASDTAPADFFGRVAIEGTTVFAGSLSDEAGEQAGAAYVFAVGESCPSIPTVSLWGVIVTTLLLACAGTILIATRPVRF